MTTRLAPIHPGEILLTEFLEPLGLSQYRVAQDLSVPPRRINEVVHGKRAITADTALRRGRHFGMSPQFWLNLQSRFDLELERDRLGARLGADVAIYAAASQRRLLPSGAPQTTSNEAVRDFWILLDELAGRAARVGVLAPFIGGVIGARDCVRLRAPRVAIHVSSIRRGVRTHLSVLSRSHRDRMPQ